MLNQYKILVDALKLTGLSFEKQKEFLPEYANIKDDVVSVFVNAFYVLPQLMDRQEVSFGAVNKILHCYVQMDLNLSIEERASDTAFANHKAWEQVRELAIEALKEMGEPIEAPPVDSIDFD